MAFIDGTVVTIALPTMGKNLHFGLVGEQWVILSYGLMLAALYLPAGALGDRYGRRRIFVIGTVGFALASALCGAAPDLTVLIVGRVLQGVAGGLLTPTSLGLLRATWGRDSSAAIGHWSAWTTLATVIGPAGGGSLVQWVSWRWIFFINLPVAVAAAGFALAAGQQDEEKDAAGRLDLVGSALAGASFAALTFGFVQAGARGFGDPFVILALVGGIVLLAAFVFAERRIANPLLPLELFRNRNLSVAGLETFLVYGALYASGFLISLYLQALHYRPLVVALLGLPSSLMLIVGAAWGGRLADRRGPRLPLAAGPAVLAGGLVLYLLVHPGSSWALVLPGAFVFGIGLCGIVAPITNIVMVSAPDRLAGLAAGVSTTVARVGGLFAVAIASLIATSAFHGHEAAKGKTPFAKGEPPVLQRASEDAFRAGMLLAAGLAIAGAGVGLAGLSDREAKAAAADSSSLPT
jgi:EmrB/QacA subfamily drug resistance transporter